MNDSVNEIARGFTKQREVYEKEIASLKKQLEEKNKTKKDYEDLLEFISSRELLTENKTLRQQLESYQGSCGMHTIDEIAKLKELITQAVPFARTIIDFNHIESDEYKEVSEWLKQAEAVNGEI